MAHLAKTRLAALLSLAFLLFSAGSPAVAQYMDMMTLLDGIGTRQFYLDADRVTGVNSIRVEKISTLPGASFGRGRLDARLAAYPEAIRYLQEQLRFNPIAKRDIGNQGFGIEDIVFLHVSGDGGTVVYADDLP